MICPICKQQFEKSTSSALPFCSERCRTIDLGRWLGETYSMPHVPDPEADETPEVPPAADGNGHAADGA
jgi:endogenous inhibitor of DNA gyrase (YacG/DUF329 family)